MLDFFHITSFARALYILIAAYTDLPVRQVLHGAVTCKNSHWPVSRDHQALLGVIDGCLQHQRVYTPLEGSTGIEHSILQRNVTIHC